MSRAIGWVYHVIRVHSVTNNLVTHLAKKDMHLGENFEYGISTSFTLPFFARKRGKGPTFYFNVEEKEEKKVIHYLREKSW